MGRINAFRAIVQIKNDTVSLYEYSSGVDEATGRASKELLKYDTVMAFNNPVPMREWVKYNTTPQDDNQWSSFGDRTEMFKDIRSIYLTRFPKEGEPHVVVTGDGNSYRVIKVEHRPNEGKYVLVVGRVGE